MDKKRVGGTFRRGRFREHPSIFGTSVNVKVFTKYDSNLEIRPHLSTKRLRQIEKRSSIETALIHLLQNSLSSLPKSGTLVKVKFYTSYLYPRSFDRDFSTPSPFTFKTVDHESNYNVRLRRKLLKNIDDQFYHPGFCENGFWSCCGMDFIYWNSQGCTPIWRKTMKPFKRAKSSRCITGKRWLVVTRAPRMDLVKRISDLTDRLKLLENSDQEALNEKFKWYRTIFLPSVAVFKPRAGHTRLIKRRIIAGLRAQQLETERELHLAENPQQGEKESVKIEVRTWSQDYDGLRMQPDEFPWKKKLRCEYPKHFLGLKRHKRLKRHRTSRRRAYMRSNVSRIHNNLRRRCYIAFEPFKEPKLT